MTALPFWKPQPIPPNEDWIAPLLKLSLAVSTAGWIVYGVFALAFDDIAVISAVVQSWLVVAGSALIVAGAEMNTAPTVVAVARKWGNGKRQPLDGVAFAASLIGSITAALIAFSIRQTRLGESWWRIQALGWGPLVAGVAIAVDFYAAAVELGLLRSDYEQDMGEWLAEEAQWNEEHGIVEPVELKAAKMADFERVLGRMNGQGGGMTTEQLIDELAADGYGPPSDSTVKRWLKKALLAEAN